MEQICGGVSVFPTAEKTLSVLVNLILPLCMRMGGGSNRTGNDTCASYSTLLPTVSEVGFPAVL